MKKKITTKNLNGTKQKTKTKIKQRNKQKNPPKNNKQNKETLREICKSEWKEKINKNGISILEYNFGKSGIHKRKLRRRIWQHQYDFGFEI